MIFPFHKIAAFANTKHDEMERALREFFPSTKVLEEATEPTREYFVEWLIFEYKQQSGSTFLVEYVLRNSNQPDRKEIDQFRQIAETQWYSDFQIGDMVRGSHLTVEDVMTGKQYCVHDKQARENLANRGLIKARIACVDSVYYFVGANPAFVPVVYTERMKKIIRGMKQEKMSVRDTALLLMNRGQTPPSVRPLTKKELHEKRKELELAYQKAAATYHATLSFEELRSYIYHENGKDYTKILQQLTKKGIPERMFIDAMQLIQDIWNYFPHKILNDFSPSELFGKFKKEADNLK